MSIVVCSLMCLSNLYVHSFTCNACSLLPEFSKYHVAPVEKRNFLEFLLENYVHDRSFPVGLVKASCQNYEYLFGFS